ncbi:WD40 repeat-like protein [Cantharellus anzutake]|uniref:WD40 repeat-like protein n=1 Tax=Cantharellus anzutake TaxID=1750568 RepID=UPI001908E25C|nr:WD40 repeat-like protein [Cantharellus anzutake]KAF8341536.1 WD40 repeat-like protein [Cantharellus anzutake]
MNFQRLHQQRYHRPVKTQTPESKHWKGFKNPVFIKQHGQVTSVQFSPSPPHYYVVTASSRVQLYAPRTHKLLKDIGRFSDVARSGNIRHDGKLVVAGDDSGLIQIFDLQSRAILRKMEEHKQPVHITKFSPSGTQILSCSDDTTVKLWDIASGKPTVTFYDHSDYVRAGNFMPSDPNLILTGSYDSTVCLLDSRTGKAEMTLGSSAAGIAGVEDALPFPSGTLALSASGPIMRVWDLVSGGKCVKALSGHQKTITCLSFDGKANRVLTGGLDHLVKVYDVSSYKVVHTMRYSAPILCLAISPDDTHIAAGMSDGTFSIRCRPVKSSEPGSSLPELGELRSSNYEFFLDEIDALEELAPQPKGPPQLKDPHEFTLKMRRRGPRLALHDKLLKEYRYSEALDVVVQPTVRGELTFSLIMELIRRDGLRSALSGRDDVTLEPILRVVTKYIFDPTFGSVACGVAMMIIELYSGVLGQSPIIDSLLVRLLGMVGKELSFQRELRSVQGMVDMLMASSMLQNDEQSKLITK